MPATWLDLYRAPTFTPQEPPPMKSRFAAAVVCSLVATWVLAQEPATTSDQSGADRTGQTIRHVVLFKFKEGAPAEKIREIEAAFAALRDKIDEVSDLEWGTNNSIENLANGFTHCFLVTFDSEEDRAAYLPHPSHQEFVTMLRPHLDEVLVIDYTPQGD
jgi:hypothetical protein